MSEYIVVAGDTFDSISRKKYGTEAQSNRIATANPGVVEPLSAGTQLTIPIQPQGPKNIRQQAEAETDDEVAILIKGKRFRFWDSVRITRAIDSMDTVQFGAPFDADDTGFRETFRPFSFSPVGVTVGGVSLFTGTMVGLNPVVENSKRVVSVSGYSLPGVLNDCTPSASSFPLEFNNQGLSEIAKSLASPFGVSVRFDCDQGAIFDRVAIDPDKKNLSFLSELAKQRNLIISSSSQGELLFLRASEGGLPVAKLAQGQPPVLSVTPVFNSQEYYSHISAIAPVTVGENGSKFTVKNSRLKGVIRPLTFRTQDTQDASVKGAVEAKLGRMFGNMASYSVKVATWRDPSGKLWSPNTSIQLISRDAMIYNDYTFTIRSIEFFRDRKSQTAILNLVLPGSFSGKVPEVLPWDV